MREWLKEKRQAAGLTMAQMAEKIGVTESAYSKIESGERQKRMDIEIARLLASAFGVTVDDIATFESGVKE
jgi:transcriptional regulator with XRE-family HTH domain